MEILEVSVDLPRKLAFLRERKARYKVLYGGRVGMKSWSISRTLLTMGVERPLRILCGRELQRSIKDSVHQLLCDQIANLNIGDCYQVKNDAIVGRNGTAFGFAGLRHNIVELKSYEGADIAWIEEAQVVSKRSWEILDPTIRKDGSEIWVSFNPELEDDETYQRFVVHPQDDSIVVHIGWQDNPWLNATQRASMEACRKRNYDDYLHIWEGHTKLVLEGAIFAKELRQAKIDNRITDVPHDKTKPVHTYWDLGWNSVSGRTAIIMAQSINATYRIIDYLEDAEHTVDWYVAELQKRPYIWGTDHLPHDAKSTNLAAGGRTVAKIMEGLGRKVKVLPRTMKVGNDINAAKTIFGQIWIDRNKCADLLQCLNRYKYSVNEETGIRSRNPEPSIYIHGADAFRQLAVAITEEKKPVEKKQRRIVQYAGAGGWMGALAAVVICIL